MPAALSAMLVVVAALAVVVGDRMDEAGHWTGLSMAASTASLLVLGAATLRLRRSPAVGPEAVDGTPVIEAPVGEEVAATAPPTAVTAGDVASSTPNLPSFSFLADDDVAVFPIEDYDSLAVGQIVAVLPKLEPDELTEVLAHERSGLARPEITAEIGRLLGR